ncbi:MAG: DUF5329 family protein [Bacteroidales bacterium]|nr:DUF5329 family protein [Bacteroidales bacterium]
MRLKFFILILATLSTNVFLGQTKKKALSEKEKIEVLISSIEQLKNAQFNRNGSLYDAKTAAKHLRSKLKNAGDDIKTVQDFIEHIASKSSMTGKEYKIIFSNGKEVTTRTFFNEILKKI